MASILANTTKNEKGTIIRGVRITRSEYDKTTKRDNQRYLGTIPQGVVVIPPAIAARLSHAEQKTLIPQLIKAADKYWQLRNESLDRQLLVARQGAKDIARQTVTAAPSIPDNVDGK